MFLLKSELLGYETAYFSLVCHRKPFYVYSLLVSIFVSTVVQFLVINSILNNHLQLFIMYSIF